MDYSSLILAILILSVHLRPVPADSLDRRSLQTYIVHVRQPENVVFETSADRKKYYTSFLPSTIDDEEEGSSLGGGRILYSYAKAVSGFAARMTAEEMREVEKKEGFLHATRDTVVPLATTRTPSFLGLPVLRGVGGQPNYGEGVIIGVVDSGVTPGHPSFSGEGMPPPPAKWRGACEMGNATALCNNKLIGARALLAGAGAMKEAAAAALAVSPVDELGHGTHTASTAAGAAVGGASVLGQASGTASGVAPRAHLAVYRVCMDEICTSSDILAGIDAAVEDGVDVISMSLGGEYSTFYDNAAAVATLGAVESGVFVSCAAGNAGPDPGSVSNDAPWVLTVAASTHDRDIRANVVLNNGILFAGQSIPAGAVSPHPHLTPLVFPGVSNRPDDFLCGDSLTAAEVKGKIVLCQGGSGERRDKVMNVKNAGGVGVILMNDKEMGATTIADTDLLPTSQVSFADGTQILQHIRSSPSPAAVITFNGTIFRASPAPVIAEFSSRGPSAASPGILKPDVTGPGVNILAAWYKPAGAFNIISGTSMSTPHLSGIAALIRSAHPSWSPAAVKSAIMTTADAHDLSGRPILDEQLNPASLLAVGAGHVNPTKAVDPGLVYDASAADYLPYLCGLRYTDAQVAAVARKSVNCSAVGTIAEWDLNYPSISMTLPGEGNSALTLKRRVKNVGEAAEVYTLGVVSPQGVVIAVEPQTLDFSAVGEEMEFTVTIKASGNVAGGVGRSMAEGQLRWTSAKHVVRSPVLVTFK